MSGILNTSEMAGMVEQSKVKSIEDLLKVSDDSLVEILKRCDADTVLIVTRIASEELNQRILMVVKDAPYEWWGDAINIPKGKITMEEARVAQGTALWATIALEKLGKIKLG